MVLCLLALPLFAVLGVFSLKYRRLTKDALKCLFKTVTLRPCESGLDDRIKAQLTGRVFAYSSRAARLVYRHYKPLSWIVLIIFLWSGYAGAVGIVNYAKYGNCNGPSSEGFCLLDPMGEYSGTSKTDPDLDVHGGIVAPSLEADDPLIGNPQAGLTIIEFGCFACPYTKKAEPIVREVLEHYDGKVNLQFKSFVIPRHENSFAASLAANCANEQGMYPDYHDALFAHQEELTNSTLVEIAASLGLDTASFEACFSSHRYHEEVMGDTLMGLQAGVQGTPTFFINGRKIVGPKPAKTFRTIINEELAK